MKVANDKSGTTIKRRRILTISTLVVAGFAFLATLPERCARAAPSILTVFNPVAYEPVKPSMTDGSTAPDDCDVRPNEAIGCEENWPDNFAIDGEHFLYFPEGAENDGKLLVFLCGGDGKAENCLNVYSAAAQRGYHVIGLTYPGNFRGCNGNFSCFGDYMWENITGKEKSASSHIAEHRQDSVVGRLVAVLEWASNQAHNPASHPGNLGWSNYLTWQAGEHDIDWTKVNIAGFSNGSSHASRMGMLFPGISRVSLFAGPNDGRIDDETGLWKPASYIQPIAGVTDTRYYGLVHYLNNATSYTGNILFEVTDNWKKFGMESPVNENAFYFYPAMSQPPDFDGAHVLVSLDAPPPMPPLIPVPTSAGTTIQEAHPSVVNNKYCSKFDEVDDDPGVYECAEFEGATIGYASAWNCILGTGHPDASSAPVANAGPVQTVECQGNGGAGVMLDGSQSMDYECDVMRYEWRGFFGLFLGQKPAVFLPLGVNPIELIAFDEWQQSIPASTFVNVTDTQPPSLSVTVTPNQLWPPNHQLVRIDATVTTSDSCGATPVKVVLTSIINSQADNGLGDGDTDRDIQGAAIGTFDTSFYVRAERAGNNLAGRTYTVTYTATDASGNRTRKSASIRVPHSN